MKLHDNQLNLIRHLIRFHYLDYESCLETLSQASDYDKIAISYAFRPLTKNKYIAKNRYGIVSVLKKGKSLFPNEKPLISKSKDVVRNIYVSRVAALLEKSGIPITVEVTHKYPSYFIPSACWRNIAPGITSTTRFAGMLLAYDKKYAVYDIADGSMEWQLRAETSLFYTKYGSYETKADGIIFICDDDKKMKIAENIIRHTMWRRKTLLASNYTERKRPVKYSKSPIQLRIQYEHVYLTTPVRLQNDLQRIYTEERYIGSIIPEAHSVYDPKEGDLEKWPLRYYVNPAFDLLKLVYFFSAVKELLGLIEQGENVSDIKYALIMHKENLKIAKMYEDVLHSERVVFYEIKSGQNA